MQRLPVGEDFPGRGGRAPLSSRNAAQSPPSGPCLRGRSSISGVPPARPPLILAFLPSLSLNFAAAGSVIPSGPDHPLRLAPATNAPGQVVTVETADATPDAPTKNAAYDSTTLRYVRCFTSMSPLYLRVLPSKDLIAPSPPSDHHTRFRDSTAPGPLQARVKLSCHGDVYI
ncbi:hypothetical protein B0H21DRAFT_25172 [Amylocystis lapponica]|nr:hypothetical protein B0H21DRAFT_25172 [Amylocystis lapponica]